MPVARGTLIPRSFLSCACPQTESGRRLRRRLRRERRAAGAPCAQRDEVELARHDCRASESSDGGQIDRQRQGRVELAYEDPIGWSWLRQGLCGATPVVALVAGDQTLFFVDAVLLSFFGGGGGARRGRSGFGPYDTYGFAPQEEKAPDLEAETQIPLAEAARGTKRRLELAAQDDCPACKGTGMIMQEERKGQDRVIRSAQPCALCHGTGLVQNRHTLEVSIPAGITDGTRMRLAGQGGHGPRPNLNGDLYLTVHIQPDRVFKLSGRDLRCELPVWDYEAALGAEITVPTLEGRLSLKVPPDSQTGRVMRLKGKGLPGRGKEPAGDLLYELKVLAPTDLTDAERTLLRELADKQRERHVPDPRAELLR